MADDEMAPYELTEAEREVFAGWLRYEVETFRRVVPVDEADRERTLAYIQGCEDIAKKLDVTGKVGYVPVVAVGKDVVCCEWACTVSLFTSTEENVGAVWVCQRCGAKRLVLTGGGEPSVRRCGGAKGAADLQGEVQEGEPQGGLPMEYQDTRDGMASESERDARVVERYLQAVRYGFKVPSDLEYQIRDVVVRHGGALAMAMDARLFDEWWEGLTEEQKTAVRYLVQYGSRDLTPSSLADLKALAVVEALAMAVRKNAPVSEDLENQMRALLDRLAREDGRG